MSNEVAKSVVTDKATKEMAIQAQETADNAVKSSASANGKIDVLITDITEIKVVTALPSDAESHPKTLYLIKK